MNNVSWNDEKWKFITEWIEKNKNFIKKNHNKHGFKLDYDYSDSENTIICLLSEYLDELHMTNKDLKLDNLTNKDEAIICNKIGNRYHAYTFNNRPFNNLRLKDLYDIPLEFDGDKNIDTISIDSSNFYSVYENSFTYELYNKEDDEVYNSNIEKVFDLLISELSPSSKERLLSVIIGTDDKGILTHEEIAKIDDVTRTAIVHNIKYIKEKIKKIFINSGIEVRDLKNKNIIHIIEQLFDYTHSSNKTKRKLGKNKKEKVLCITDFLTDTEKSELGINNSYIYNFYNTVKEINNAKARLKHIN